MNNISKKKRKKSVKVAIKSVQNIQKFVPNPKTSNPYPVALYEKEKQDKENMKTILKKQTKQHQSRTNRSINTSKTSGKMPR